MSTTINKPSLLGSLESLRGYQILTATLGTNGNGGCMSDADSIINHAEDNGIDLSNYDPTDFEWDDLVDHWTDATTEPVSNLGEKADWIAFDWVIEDDDGYLTGSTNRIYICIVI